MKPIIGIIMRVEDNKHYLRRNITFSVTEKGGIPIGIFIDDIENAVKIINLCDGIILPGGDNIEQQDLQLIKYIYDKNIPCLGICLGMQEMGYLFDGEMNKICNYNHLKPNIKYAHNIKINKNSKLYEILKNDIIKVNSRHKDYLISTNLDISGISDVIESIEDKNKHFFIGVQWHPEDMIKYDENSNLLIEQFIKESSKYQLNKNKNI